MKRNDYISWDEYFMGISLLSAQRSKDSHTQVGACIVSQDDEMPWDRNGEFLDTKYPFVCHAELNAILNHAAGSLQNAKIYVSLFPCNECAKAIIQSGIKEVVYWEDKYADTDGVKASKKMFELTGVKIRRYIPTNREITIRL